MWPQISWSGLQGSHVIRITATVLESSVNSDYADLVQVRLSKPGAHGASCACTIACDVRPRFRWCYGLDALPAGLPNDGSDAGAAEWAGT